MDANRIDLGGQWRRAIDGRLIDFVPVPGSYAPVGQCVLEREFDCPWTAGGAERMFLVTEGVLASAAFELNGRPIGLAGPWATYRLELPPGLLAAHNTIRATVRDIVDDFGPTPGRRFDGGLVRDLYIERRPAAFLAGMAFRAELAADFSSA